MKNTSLPAIFGGLLLTAMAVTGLNAQPPAAPSGSLPPSRRELHTRNVESMPQSRREAVLGEGYRIRTETDVPTARRIIRPGFSDWQLGVNTSDGPMGLRIENVQSWTPAYAAGLEPGDFILDVNGYPVGFYPGGYFPLQSAFASLADPSGWVELGIWNKRTKREEYMWVQLVRR